MDKQDRIALRNWFEGQRGELARRPVQNEADANEIGGDGTIAFSGSYVALLEELAWEHAPLPGLDD